MTTIAYTERWTTNILIQLYPTTDYGKSFAGTVTCAGQERRVPPTPGALKYARDNARKIAREMAEELKARAQTPIDAARKRMVAMAKLRSMK